jgi:hypothetical protein
LGRTVTALDDQGRWSAVFDDGSTSDYDLVVGAGGGSGSSRPRRTVRAVLVARHG